MQAPALVDLHQHHARPLAIAARLHEPAAGPHFFEIGTSMVEHVALAPGGSGVDGAHGMLVLAMDAQVGWHELEGVIAGAEVLALVVAVDGTFLGAIRKEEIALPL